MNLTARPARLSTTAADFESAFSARLHWSAETDAQVEQSVAEILSQVRMRGDAAVLEYTRRFDALDAGSLAELELTAAELERAFDGLPERAKDRVYLRLWEVLTGKDRSERFKHLSSGDRQAVLEILRETKEGLPDYWKP